MINSMQPEEDTCHRAILLIGPTGSGKTPLGQLLQQRGLWGLRCLHFDFGHELRRSAIDASSVLSLSERGIVVRMLETGALLEDEHFHIAHKLLEDFLRREGADMRTLVVLNGLPRHTGQAEAMENIIRVVGVISLKCTPETVMRRIDTNAGGDRTGRIDDSLAEIERKLKIFDERTLPLLRYYRKRHAGITEVEVGPLSTAADMLDKIVKGAVPRL
jgi:adenylate kinase family enzyme